MGHQVLDAGFHELGMGFGVGCIQGPAREHGGAATVHLEGPDGGHDDGDVGGEAAEAALEVPELLEADVGAESALGDVVVGQLQAHLVGDDGGLADGDVGEGAGVNQNRAVLRWSGAGWG